MRRPGIPRSVRRKPVERIKQLLDISEQLVFSRGYDNISVADIISSAGVSKGAFYHYFKSKEHMLDCIVARRAQRNEARVKHIVSSGTDPIEKINGILFGRRYYEIERDTGRLAMRGLFMKGNLQLLDKTVRRRMRLITSALTTVIEEGVAEGVFDTRNPRFVAKIIPVLEAYYANRLSGLVINMKAPRALKEELIQELVAYQNLMERVLGAETGSIRVTDLVRLRQFLELD